MSYLLPFLLLFAPKAPVPTCPCELHDWKCRAENPVCAEQQPQRTLPPAPAKPTVEEPSPIEKRAAKPKFNSFKADGMYLLVSPAGVSVIEATDLTPVPVYLWGFDVGGWLDLVDPLSLSIGIRFDHGVGDRHIRATVPFRVGVSSHFATLYASMAPGFGTIKGYCVYEDDSYYIDCARAKGANIGLSAGLLFLVSRGFTMGFEPGIDKYYFKVGDNNPRQTATVFSFRVWTGWKFGRTTD